MKRGSRFGVDEQPIYGKQMACRRKNRTKTTLLKIHSIGSQQWQRRIHNVWQIDTICLACRKKKQINNKNNNRLRL